MNALLLTLIQLVVMLAVAPLTVGVIRKLKARFQNRRGASVFQPYWALLALCRKEMTISEHTSWVFRVVPFVVLGSSMFLAMMLPTVTIGGWFAAHVASVFMVGAVLVIGSLFLVFGGMDVASAFGGMGSSREMTLAAIVEPAVVVFFLTLGLLSGIWNVDGALSALTITHWTVTHPLFVVSLFGLLFIVLAENARYPVDNPATHLELTMVHEAMILEYSGPYLAMLEYASAVKLTVLAVLFLNLVSPVALVTVSSGLVGVMTALIGVLVKVLIAAGIVAFIESAFAKMRFYRMQEYMATAFFLCFAGLIMIVLA